MAKKNRKIIKKIEIEIFAVALIVLSVILAGCLFYYSRGFVASFFSSDKLNNYRLESKYYGFNFQTPKGWVVERNTLYSDDYVGQLLSECRGDKATNEIGAFRIESSKYPKNVESTGLVSPSVGFSGGVMLEITVNCFGDIVNVEEENNFVGNIKVAGEAATEQFVDAAGLGRVKYTNFFHNNLQYKIKEYYISQADKISVEKLKADYAGVANEIISSFKFTK